MPLLMPSRPHDLPVLLQFTLLVAGFALLALLAWNITPSRPQGEAATAELRFGGTTYGLPLQRLPELEHLTRRHFQTREAATLNHVTTRLEQDIDAVFMLAHARVPELADWYYSLGGEYTRMMLPLLVRGGVLGADHLAERTERLLFGDQLLAGHLDTIRSDIEDLLLSQNLASRKAWQAEMATALEGWGMAMEDSPGLGSGIDLDRFGQRLTGYDSPEFLTRMTLSSSAGIGAMAGPLIWQAASRRAAASGRAAATRGASRVASRAGSAAAGGALACAPAGPAAVGCALLAGTAAWLGTDWLLLRFDEARNREALEGSLHAALTATREALSEDLRQHYQRISLNRQQILTAEIEYTFIPAYHRHPPTPGTLPP
ncbi:MAG: hypothetical protein JJT88_07860 [Gammaproteobacteria bacterium]|nr:hypothetical protein [Gammaproteobacteria bacterium]